MKSTSLSSYGSHIKLRIPPSPTGSLHLGTVRTALYNLLVAKRHAGSFVLRLEDTDRERSKPEYVDDILDGLQWMGIHWDEGPYRQSEHKARHHFVVEQLLANNLAYECFCSPEELEELRISQRAQNVVEGYDNRHRTLSEAERTTFRAAGRRPVIRFKLPDCEQICWNDLIRGSMKVNTSDLGGDPVIAKDGGDVLYNFAVVVDDHDAGITHVVRGEDHLHNTAKQIPIYEAMGWDVPIFAHVPLILTSTREKLSKRKHGDIAGIAKYKAEGYPPEGIANYLIAMSWQHPDPLVGEVFSVDQAIPHFALEDISRSAAVFDQTKLHWFCKEHHKLMSSELMLKRAEAFGIRFVDASGKDFPYEHKLLIVSLLKDGLVRLCELPAQLKPFCAAPHLTSDHLVILTEPKSIVILTELMKLIEAHPSATVDTIKNVLFEELASKTACKKGKALFLPIRIALCASSSGADLASIIYILGSAEVSNRLGLAIQFIKDNS